MSDYLPALKEGFYQFDDRLECAFIHGSVARGEEKSTIDVDLLIIGSIGLADLAPTLRRLEKQFNREFNAACFTHTEFREKARAGNHFL